MSEKAYRFIKLEPDNLRKSDNGVITASLSSEEPVERWFGNEVLKHTADAIDFTRAQNGLPLLFNHDTNEPIGLAKNFRLDGSRTRADLYFGNSQRAQEIAADIRDGLLTGVSIGYLVHSMTASPDQEDTFIVDKWEPIEASIAPVPADDTVGIGRSQNMHYSISRGISMDNPQQTSSARRSDNRSMESERERVSEIMYIGEKYDEMELARTYIERGDSSDEFAKIILERMGNTRPLPSSHDDLTIGLSEREVKQFSFVRAINAMISNDWAHAGFERECSRAIQQKTGRASEGILIPADVLSPSKRDLTVGTPTAGGYLVPTEYDESSFIDLYRNKLLVEQMGAMVLPGLSGNVAIPRQTGASTGYWVGEGASPTKTQPAFDQVTLAPKTVGAYSDYTRKLLLQSSPAIENIVRSDLAASLAVEVDRAAFNGSGTGSEPTGILNTTGISILSLGTNGGALDWNSIVELEGMVAAYNADRGSLGYATNSTVRKALKKTLKSATAGAEFIWGDEPGEFDTVNGYRAGVTNNIPNNLTKGTGTNLSALIYGNFSDLIIGYWSIIELITDIYTLSSSGGVRVVALQDIDINVRHAVSFAVVDDVIA